MVAAAVTVGHWPVMSAQALSYDDDLYLINNAYVQNPGWSSTAFFFGELFETTTLTGYSHPVALTSIMLDYAAGGRPDNLRQFHRTNLMLHVLGAVSVMLLVYWLFGQPWPAAVAALLFGLHPLTVEPIAWLGQRKALLAGSFSLACLALYVLWVRRSNLSARRPGLSIYAVALALYVLALLSKPTATPVVALLVLLDIWPLRRLSGRTLLEKVPFALVAGVSTVIAVISHAATAQIRLTETSIGDKIMLAGHKLAFYYGKMLWPTDLTSYYPAPEPLSLANPCVLIGCVVTGLIAVFLIVSLRWTRSLAIGWLIFFVALFPALGLIGYSWVYAFDNYLYLPAVGLVLALAYAMTRVWSAQGPGRKRAGRVIILAGALIVALLEARATRAYLQQWRDTDTLHRYMVELAPASAKPHFVRAYYLNYEGRRAEAVAEFRETIGIDPDHSGAHTNLAVILSREGKTNDALTHFHQAVRIDPHLISARMGLGDALCRLGRFDDAIPHYREVIRGGQGSSLPPPELAAAHCSLANALANSGRLDDAIEHYKAALRLEPAYSPAIYNLNKAFVAGGRREDGIEFWKQFVGANPSNPANPNIFRILAGALLEHGEGAEAVSFLRRALQEQPAWIEVAHQLAWVLSTHDDPAVRNGTEAVSIARRLCQATEFKHPTSLDILAAAYAETGQFREAVKTARQALSLMTTDPRRPLAEAIQKRIQMYRERKPLRAGAMDDSP